MTEINSMAKTGFDRAFYATQVLIDDQRVFLGKYRINGIGRAVKVYRTTENLKLTEDVEPPDPEPDAVAKKKKKKKEPKPRVLSSAARVKLIRSRHRALIKSKKQREEKVERRFGATANTEEWSEDQ